MTRNPPPILRSSRCFSTLYCDFHSVKEAMQSRCWTTQFYGGKFMFLSVARREARREWGQNWWNVHPVIKKARVEWAVQSTRHVSANVSPPPLKHWRMRPAGAHCVCVCVCVCCCCCCCCRRRRCCSKESAVVLLVLLAVPLNARAARCALRLLCLSQPVEGHAPLLGFCQCTVGSASRV